MKLEQAKEMLSKAKSVQEWNEIRESLKPELSVSELARIDGCGLINKVKKQNGWIIEAKSEQP
jgi:hypothetical protein